MTLFDRLAGIAEKHSPGLIPLLHDTKVFEFDKDPAGFLPREYPQAEMDRIEEEFFLPFNSVFILDRWSGVLLRDTAPGQRGTAGDRDFILVMDAVARPEFKLPQKGRPDDEKETCVIAGTLSLVQHPDPDLPWEVSITKDSLVHSFADGIVTPESVGIADWNRMWKWSVRRELGEDAPPAQVEAVVSRHRHDVMRDVATDALKAIQEVILFNTPDRFPLEISPTKMKKAKNGRVLRSHQRPKYSLLKPSAIRKMMRVKEPGMTPGTKKRPHERRRHLRTYRSDRYKAAKGKTVLIDAQWVGPTEAVVGSKRYRVITDI